MSGPTAGTATQRQHASLDEGTLADALDGSPAAWRRLVLAYDGMVRAVARRHRLQACDVEDVAQCTWLRLLEHGRSVQDPARLGGWLATTAARESLRLLARNGRETVTDPGQWQPLPGAEGDPADLAVEQALFAGVREVVAGLPARPRTILQALAAPHQPSYAQVAGDLGLPIGSIGPTRRRALQQSRALLEARDLVLAG